MIAPVAPTARQMSSITRSQAAGSTTASPRRALAAIMSPGDMYLSPQSSRQPKIPKPREHLVHGYHSEYITVFSVEAQHDCARATDGAAYPFHDARPFGGPHIASTWLPLSLRSSSRLPTP